jgi:phage terminase large subunit-like protein
MPLKISLASELLEYCDGVISNKIVSCQKHKWACERFKRDMARAGTDDFPFIFIPERAERFFSWLRLFKHRKGVLKGKSIEPNIIHKFIFGNIYGWYHKDTGYRRFNKAYWQVARKNTKSQYCAGVGTYECGAYDKSGTEASEVYCAATKTEQAKIVYDESVAMIKGNPIVASRYTVAYGRIMHKKTGSVMRALSEEDKKTGDGLNVQCGIIDEYHAHETSEIYDIIDSGMGARAEPLLLIITTAGFDLANPCFRVEYDLVTKILDPNIPVNLESYFVMINELEKNNTDQPIEIDGRKIPPGELIDDIRNEEVWVKANPIICSYDVGCDYLRKKLKEAIEAPEKMRNFLTKHMNVWVNQRECGYLQMDKWAACKADKKVEIEGKTVFSGLDLSATIDLTSIGFEIPLPEDYYYVLSHSFMPEETFEIRRKKDKVPYDLWVSGGWITLTSGAEVDYHIIFEYLKKIYEKNNWIKGEICFDRALATWLTQELGQEGFTPIDIPQSYTGLSAATKDFRGKVYQRKIIHDGNPVLSWSMSNAVTRSGPSENIMLDKARARQRIDPSAALINAHVRAMIKGISAGYNDRDMRGF